KPGTTFIEMDYKIKNLRKLISGERVNISTLPSAEIAALCAIGNPDSFKETLKHAGLNIRKYYIYPDHHFFTIDEILKILENKPLIITTEKDSVKIESIIKENPVKSHFDSIYVLEICPEIISGKEIWEKIIKASQPYSLTETAPS
ncbi:MAG: tetraacyldisaccharide 4'-kinase, partial [Elusimicrobiota bacterium]